MRTPKSYLYVPADRPERLAKAHTRKADATIADLEDSVAEDAKAAARANILRWLDTVPADGPSIWVRVNSGERREAEILALASHPALTGFFLPKTDSSHEVNDANALVARAGRRPLLAPMIESAKGLTNIHSIAASANVHQLHIGEMDLVADLGVTPGAEATELLHARSLMVIASRSADLVPPAAPVSSEINDIEAYRRTTEQLRNLGYFGRDCIHPAQVQTANDVFAPSPEQIAWAENVLRTSRAERGAFRDQDGSMVDEAVLRRARNILDVARAH
jgi:citrate lyase subunit beta / citryl-CoA lyase